MSENLWFSDVFKGYRNATLDQNGLKSVYFVDKIKTRAFGYFIINFKPYWIASALVAVKKTLALFLIFD